MRTNSVSNERNKELTAHLLGGVLRTPALHRESSGHALDYLHSQVLEDVMRCHGECYTGIWCVHCRPRDRPNGRTQGAPRTGKRRVQCSGAHVMVCQKLNLGTFIVEEASITWYRSSLSYSDAWTSISLSTLRDSPT